jgi:hypothetical protein
VDEEQSINHSAWPAFAAWAVENELDPENDAWVDLETWWSCFLAGYEAHT